MLKEHKLGRKKDKGEPKVRIEELNNEDKRKQYEEETKLVEVDTNKSPQEKWNTIVNKCKEIGKDVLGKREKRDRTQNPTLKKLTEEKQKIKKDINAETDQQAKKDKCKELREKKKQIHKCIKESEEKELDERLRKLEESGDEPSRYYRVMRDIQYKKPRPLQIKDENNYVAGTDERKVEIITNYFKKMFAPEGYDTKMKEYPPTKMDTPFTGEEVHGAAKKLKNGKSANGIDTLHAEYIKYADENIHMIIASLFNDVAETGNHPEELQVGVLTPLQKPNKKQKVGGEGDHLRPIMLLSVLRKILTICVIGRIWDRLKARIPHEQAAYQGERSGAEQVLAVKLLAEKAINSNDYKIFLSLFDMSKAFDTVNRRKLFEHLERILNPDELHLLSIITNFTKVKIKVNEAHGDLFVTYIGIMQGDCLSALLFIFYLAECLQNEREGIEDSILIAPKYADDVTYALTNKPAQVELKRRIPVILDTHDLTANETKTEEYEIPKPPPPPRPPPTMDELIKHKDDKICWSALDWLVHHEPAPIKDTTPDWAKCKLLGTLLETENDFKKRKILTIDSLKKHNNVFTSRYVGHKMKLRTFNMYVGSVFLHNTETWAVNKTILDKIDSFHRRMLRNAINYKWPRKISNIELYQKTEAIPWSQVIKKRRLTFLGHIMRRHDQTPVQIALKEALRPAEGKVGRPKITWLRTIANDLKDSTHAINIKHQQETLTTLTSITQDRQNWRRVVGTLMRQ